jgi:hypothetical protein
MFYFSADASAQGPGFDISVVQHSCDEALVNSFDDKIHTESDHAHRPMTGCDAWLSGEKEVITSPSYPLEYPPSTRCTYTINRFMPDVCFVRLRFINFDLEPSPNCQSDYLYLEGNNERLCKPSMTSSERVLPIPPSGQVRLVFNSDAHVSRTGFKIMTEQIRNSCRPAGPGTSSYYPPPTMRPVYGIEGPSSSAAPRICNRSSASFLVISSEQYPNNYRPNTDCVYRINKRSPRVCGLEVFFQDFSVGTWDTSLVCTNDYVKIADEYFCGYRKNERRLKIFPPGIDFIDIRFFTDNIMEYPGFMMELRQVENCRMSPGGVGTFRGGRKFPLVPIGGVRPPVVQTDIDPRTGDLPPPTPPTPSTGPFCGTRTFTSETFDIVSPGYERGTYDPWTDCHYTVKKMHFSVCALEVKFNAFSLEGSVDGTCRADFLQVGDDVKLCGKLAPQSTSE